MLKVKIVCLNTKSAESAKLKKKSVVIVAALVKASTRFKERAHCKPFGYQLDNATRLYNKLQLYFQT